MCATCGCSGTATVGLLPPDRSGRAGATHPQQRGHHQAAHEHAGHEHSHPPHEDAGHIPHPQDPGHVERTVELQQKVLAKNDRLAQLNRD